MTANITRVELCAGPLDGDIIDLVDEQISPVIALQWVNGIAFYVDHPYDSSKMDYVNPVTKKSWRPI